MKVNAVVVVVVVLVIAGDDDMETALFQRKGALLSNSNSHEGERHGLGLRPALARSILTTFS